MRRTVATIAVAAAALAVAVPALAANRGAHARAGRAPASRLDDGKRLLPKAKITEQQAIAAARTAASGGLNEVDLEYAGGRLVFNVDVGPKDVKVDAATGDVVAVDQDD